MQPVSLDPADRWLHIPGRAGERMPIRSAAFLFQIVIHDCTIFFIQCKKDVRYYNTVFDLWTRGFPPMKKMQIILTAPPQFLRSASFHRATIAHMVYHLGEGGHLFRDTSSTAAVRGGLMVIDDQPFDEKGEIPVFCKEVLQECISRSFRGVILHFHRETSPLSCSIVSHLATLFAQRSLPLYVPETYANISSKTMVMISTAISGGSLHQRLTEAVTQYGATRIALDVERVAADFFLPAPDGIGTPLTFEALQTLREKHHPAIFFSNELCSHYFTYTDDMDHTHFVLFDDMGSMKKKLQVAASFHIQTAIFFYPEIADWTSSLLS